VSVRICLLVCLFGSLLPPVFATDRIPSEPDVTVVLDFKGAWSPVAIQAMEREASQIIGVSGIRLGWTNPADAVHSTFANLVVMRFRGSCNYAPNAAAHETDQPGAYASTRTTNGEVQPFGDVDCDRVSSSVHAAMFGGDYANPAMLVGRALGRVVAHELVHMLTKSNRHSAEGVQKAALSGQELIMASLPLSAADVDRLILTRRN
jgi:hypothetical protein